MKRATRCHPLGWLLVSLVGLVATQAAPRPNFVVVLVDDLGYGDLSCYGNRAVETRNIDRLAAEGLRFEQFYVASPICSPSRTALTTGQYPARWRITSFLNNRQANAQRGMAQWLDPKAPTLARLLREAGYTTGHFGKWHMGGQRDVGDAPLISEYGFDASLTQFEGLGDRILPLCDGGDGQPPRRHSLGSDTLGRGTITWLDRSQVTAAFVERTLAFIREAEAADRPFYVNVWPDDVHSPFFPPRESRRSEAKKDLFHAVLVNMDRQLGPLFDYIRSRPRLRDNTLILLAGDNGPEPGAGSAGPFRGHKGTLYEGGTREALIAWGPGLMPESARGRTNQETVIGAVDVAPSLLRLAGVPVPSGVRFDGVDLSAALTGRGAPGRPTPLFWNRPPDRPGTAQDRWPDLALREGPWKLLLMEDGSAPQLYDLSKDPAETINVAARHPDVVQRLSRDLLAWRKGLPISPPLPVDPAAQAAPKRAAKASGPSPR